MDLRNKTTSEFRTVFGSPLGVPNSQVPLYINEFYLQSASSTGTPAPRPGDRRTCGVAVADRPAATERGCCPRAVTAAPSPSLNPFQTAGWQGMHETLIKDSKCSIKHNSLHHKQKYCLLILYITIHAVHHNKTVDFIFESHD